MPIPGISMDSWFPARKAVCGLNRYRYLALNSCKTAEFHAHLGHAEV